MKTILRSSYISYRARLCVGGAAILGLALLSSCTGKDDGSLTMDHAPMVRGDVVDPASRALAIDGSLATVDPGIDQIPVGDAALSAPQINESNGSEPVRLTIDQLREYRDRCAPDAKSKPPADYDCSQSRLRVRRAFRSDDDLARALAVLDQLAHPQDERSLTGRGGRSRKSIESSEGALAAASGALNGSSALSPETAAATGLAQGLQKAIESGDLSPAPGVVIVSPPN